MLSWAKGMKATRIRAHCPRCRHDQNFCRAKVGHHLHLIFSVVTLGLWIVPWISITIGMLFRPWRCQHCGWHKPDFEAGRSKGEPTRAGLTSLRPHTAASVTTR